MTEVSSAARLKQVQHIGSALSTLRISTFWTGRSLAARGSRSNLQCSPADGVQFRPRAKNDQLVRERIRSLYEVQCDS